MVQRNAIGQKARVKKSPRRFNGCYGLHRLLPERVWRSIVLSAFNEAFVGRNAGEHEDMFALARLRERANFEIVGSRQRAHNELDRDMRD